MVLATGVAARTARRLVAGGTQALHLPCIWTGLAEHHMEFGGTVTLDLDVFMGVLRGAARSVARHGFRRIALLNGHGGNTEAVAMSAIELTRELGVPVVGLTYWLANADTFGAILETQPNVQHACEAETSMMMALARRTCGRRESRRPSPAARCRPRRRVPPEPALRAHDGQGVIGDPRAARARRASAAGRRRRAPWRRSWPRPAVGLTA
jgi:creatinine amidohydrolase